MTERKKALKRQRKPIKRSRLKKRPPKPKTARQKQGRLTRAKANPYSTYWRNKCDAIWAKIVLILAGHRCERCGSKARPKSKLDPHHLIARARPRTRHALENGMCLCPSCHRFDQDAAHGPESYRFMDWIREKHPNKWKWMQAHRRDVGRANYQQRYEELQTVMEELCPKARS